MKTPSITTVTLASLMGVCVQGCAAETSPAEAGGLQLGLTDGAGDDSVAGEALMTRDQDGTGFLIDTAFANVRHIELYLPDGTGCDDVAGVVSEPVRCDGDSDKLVIEGPFVVDLISGASEPSLADIALPAGIYERVDVRFDDFHGDDFGGDTAAPGVATLEGHSMHMAGSLETDLPMDFVLDLKFNEDARFEAPTGVALGRDGHAALLLLDVSEWFQALPITACMEAGDLSMDGETLLIRDGDNACSDVENALKDAIKRSGQLGGE